MKNKILPLALVLASLAAAGCTKEHQCECSDPSTTTLLKTIMEVDGGMKCEDITEMGYEEKYVNENGEHALRRTMHKVKCRDYGRD